MTVSMLAVASSRMRISGSRSTARMKAINCFWPSERESPPPVWVASPSLKRARKPARPWASSRALRSSCERPARPS